MLQKLDDKLNFFLGLKGYVTLQKQCLDCWLKKDKDENVHRWTLLKERGHECRKIH